MKVENILNKIDNKKWYPIKEINDLGVFLDGNGKPSLFVLYRLIKGGRLKAQNVGVTNQPRYLVKGSDLREELERRYKQFIK